MKRQGASLRAIFLGGVAIGAFSLAGTAWAQNTSAGQPQTAPPAPVEQTQPQQAEQGGDRVVITGSRIAKDQFTSASPIVVITSEAATLQGMVDTADILQSNSIASGSTQINGQFGGFVVEGGPGVRTVALRGLGSQRTLVLLNGRRLGGAGTTGTTGAVDLNVIPDSIVQRIEILKDGASSIYGSDAVAGVVNVITRGSVAKPELNIQWNEPFDTGGTSYSIDGAYGFNFPNGAITLAGSWQHREELDVGEREATFCAQDYVFDVNSGARADIINLRPGDPPGYKCRGGLTDTMQVLGSPVGGQGNNIVYVRDASVTGGPLPGFRPRSVVAAGNADLDGFDRLAQKNDALDGANLYSFFATADFDLGPVDFYGELLANRRDSTVDQTFNFAPQVHQDNPFNPFPSVANPASTVGRITAFIQRPSFNTEATVDYYSAVAGLKGELGISNWTWDVYATYSKSDGEYSRYVLDGRNFESANNPFADVRTFVSGGQIVCQRISSPSTSCPVINYLDQRVLGGALTQTEQDFLFEWDTGNTEYEQTLFAGTVTGDLFQLPAGPLGVALGVEYRDISLKDRPGPLSDLGVAISTTIAKPTTGDDKITEVFGEFEIPILEGVPGIEELTASLSGRWFDYESAGDDTVWKAGLNWQINPLVRIRGTTGTSYRAPALFELFQGAAVGFQQQTAIDPCINWGLSSNENLRANCAAIGIPDNYPGGPSGANIIRGGGGQFLKPETSEAKTLGVIFTPTWLDLSVAVDYFDIEVADEIAVFGAASITSACYGSPNFPNGFCNLLTRETNANLTTFRSITEIRDTYININRQSNRGIDVTLRYDHDFDFGNLLVEGQGTWTFEDEVELFDGATAAFNTDDFNGTVSEPDFTAGTRVSLERGDWTYNWFMDYVGRASNDELFADTAQAGGIIPYTNNNGPTTVRLKRYAETTIYHDLSVRYRNDDWSITAGVNNVFDEQPPSLSTSSGSTRLGIAPVFGTQYDLLGRAWFVQIGKTF